MWKSPIGYYPTLLDYKEMNKEELIEYLEAIKREMEDIEVPLIANDLLQEEISDRCMEVKKDMLNIISKRLRELRRLT